MNNKKNHRLHFYFHIRFLHLCISLLYRIIVIITKQVLSKSIFKYSILYLVVNNKRPGVDIRPFQLKTVGRLNRSKLKSVWDWTVPNSRQCGDWTVPNSRQCGDWTVPNPRQSGDWIIPTRDSDEIEPFQPQTVWRVDRSNSIQCGDRTVPSHDIAENKPFHLKIEIERSNSSLCRD